MQLSTRLFDPGGNEMRLLLVDDDAGFRELLRTTFEDVQVEVDEAGSAAEAETRISASRPDVIVLDVNLPGIGGLDLCGRIARLHPDLKVIVFTAADDPDIRRQAFAAGATAFVSKLALDGSLLSTIDGFGAAQD
jgi:CheY-like chemotaxis protein